MVDRVCLEQKLRKSVSGYDGFVEPEMVEKGFFVRVFGGRTAAYVF
jgi:hypothetical protein